MSERWPDDRHHPSRDEDRDRPVPQDETPVTRAEFEDMCGDSETPLPIRMSDGRIGLCPHWTDEHVLVDVYGEGNTGVIATIDVPWARIFRTGPRALRTTFRANVPRNSPGQGDANSVRGRSSF
jgi:hypothetical protein